MRIIIGAALVLKWGITSSICTELLRCKLMLLSQITTPGDDDTIKLLNLGLLVQRVFERDRSDMLTARLPSSLTQSSLWLVACSLWGVHGCRVTSLTAGAFGPHGRRGQRWFGSSSWPPSPSQGGKKPSICNGKKQTNSLSTCNRGYIFSSVKQLSDEIVERNDKAGL